MNSNFKLSEQYNYYNDKQFKKSDFLSFWKEISLNLNWDKLYTKIWSGNEKKPEWFKDGLINVCNNVLDKNLKELGNEIAFIHECPTLNFVSKITYNELFKKVCVFSSVLKSLKINKGDIVMIVMPNCLETYIAMLACARIGAIYSNTSIELNSNNISSKLNYLKPKLLITVNFSCFESNYNFILPTIKQVIKKTNYNSKNVIILDRDDFINKDKQIDIINQLKLDINDYQIEGALKWNELYEKVCINQDQYNEYELLNSNHPMSISFSSGTTGEPKGFIYESGCSLAFLYYSFKSIFGFEKGKIFYCAPNIGWKFTQNQIFGSLFHGCTTITVEGSFKSFDLLGLIDKYNIEMIFSMIQQILVVQKNYPSRSLIYKNYNLSSLKTISLGGETIFSSIADYIQNEIGVTLNNNYGLTECGAIISTMITNDIPFRLHLAGIPVLNFKVSIKSIINKNKIEKSFELGELVIKLPLNPSQSQNLYNDDKEQSKYNQEYLNEYPGYFRTSDLAYFDNDGYYYIVGRVKDAINLGNGKIVYNSFFEDNIQLNNKVYDNVVVPVSILNNDSSNSNQVPAAFIVLNDEFKDEYNNNQIQFINQLKYEINQSLKFNEIVNNVFIEYIIIVDELPKSVSNKKLGNLLSNIFENKQYTIPSTILNENIINNLENTIKNYKLLNKIK